MQAQYLPHVATVLYDPVHTNRHLTRNALFSLGFRDIDLPITVIELRRALELGDFDLAILDVTEDEEAICALVRDLRHGVIGRNPFMIIIMTTWNQRGDLVRRVIDSGADDLLLRPLSTGQLKTRIAQQADARKDFVVTSTYIGPDRRRDSARRNDETLIAVPNSLKLKALEGVLSGPSLTEVSQIRERIDRRRIEQDAFHVAITCRLLSEHMRSGQTAVDSQKELTQLMATIADLRTRIAAPGFETVAMFCDGLTSAGEDLFAALNAGREAAAEKPLALLSELARGIQIALDPSKNEETLAREIGDTVARIHARLTVAVPADSDDGRSAARA